MWSRQRQTSGSGRSRVTHDENSVAADSSVTETNDRGVNVLQELHGRSVLDEGAVIWRRSYWWPYWSHYWLIIVPQVRDEAHMNVQPCLTCRGHSSVYSCTQLVQTACSDKVCFRDKLLPDWPCVTH